MAKLRAVMLRGVLMGVILSSGSLAHVGKTFLCVAMVPGSCQNDRVCTVLFDDSKGVQSVYFNKPAGEVRPGGRVCT